MPHASADAHCVDCCHTHVNEHIFLWVSLLVVILPSARAILNGKRWQFNGVYKRSIPLPA